MLRKTLALFALIFVFSCDKNTQDPVQTSNYFPSVNSSEWETTEPSDLGWNVNELSSLYGFLEENNTRAFLVLKDGRIVIEQYFGNKISGGTFDKDSYWYWASAGKTLTGFLVGIAQEQGFLDINQPSSDFLGIDWTSLSPSQENAILIKHQLSMTSGLSDLVSNPDCTTPNCLVFLSEPENRWAYHNAPYTLLDNVISSATNQSFDNYFESQIQNKIGMLGFWNYVESNHVYFSTPRSMARFGLLMLNRGNWAGDDILNDKEYFDQMVNSSQNLNPSYGYLTWLNGKEILKVPGSQQSFNTSISPSAPADMFAAMGKNGQFMNVVPSKGLVVIRMGESPDNSLVPFTFQDALWEKLNLVISH